jgi:hypothetical protein
MEIMVVGFTLHASGLCECACAHNPLRDIYIRYNSKQTDMECTRIMQRFEPHSVCILAGRSCAPFNESGGGALKINCIRHSDTITLDG